VPNREITMFTHALRPRRWSPLPPHHPVSRAMQVVLGVIVLSTCFGLLHVVDVAVSGAMKRLDTATTVPPRADRDADVDGATAVDASLVDMPPASVDAISL
jgi:hypothetical protein